MFGCFSDRNDNFGAPTSFPGVVLEALRMGVSVTVWAFQKYGFPPNSPYTAMAEQFPR